MNAVVHKEYLSSTPIQIRIYDNRLFIWNPGEFPSSITPTNIYDEHVSNPHNPNLANIFFRCGFIESWGRGYSKIKIYCEREKAVLPKIEIKQQGISVSCFASDTYKKLYKQSLFSMQKTVPILNKDSVCDSKNSIDIILDYLKSNKTIKNSDVVKLLQINAKAANRLLNKCVDDNILNVQGKNRGRIYYLVEDVR